ncbi:MAG: C2H2-type zinc finger protein [Dehalococcoidia bacterium]|nr:C2H2-type zinc finger protein [Dehalococcoidia bacterium]
MYQCKQCGKEFGDWHALGGHTRTHRESSRKGDGARAIGGGGMPDGGHEDGSDQALGRALGRLSELSGEEAWRIVVQWILDVYRQARLRDEIIDGYRLRIRESETRIEAVQSELKKLQQQVAGQHVYKGPNNQL